MSIRRPLHLDLGQRYRTIGVPRGTGAATTEPFRLGEFKSVASYNWVDLEEPTIVVPGAPPVWRNRPLPVVVGQDHLEQFVDQNSARARTSPLSPLIAAVKVCDPSFDFKPFDIVTDRNTLRKLLRWASGEADRDFRIDVELIGTSLILQRWESKPVQGPSRGYGHNFKFHMIRGADCMRGYSTTGQHRVASYDFAGLKLLVRFSVDATLTDHSREPTVRQPLQRGGRQPKAPQQSSLPLPQSKPLNIIHHGLLVPDSSLVKIQTRVKVASLGPTVSMNVMWHQLFFAEARTLYIARQTKGVFSSIDKYSLESVAVHGEAQVKLERLADALRHLLQQTRRYRQRRKVSWVCKRGVLSVFQRLDSVGLPDSQAAYFR